MASQFGLITRAQALSAGMTDREIHWRRRRREWLAVEAGVYLHAASAAHELQPLRATLFNSGGYATSRSALHLFGLHSLPVEPDVMTPKSRRGVRSGSAHRNSIDPFRITRRQGCPTVDVVGALVTSAVVLDRGALGEVVADAINRRITTPTIALEWLNRVPTQSRPGAADLRAIVERYVDTRAEESRLESAMLQVLRRAGLEPTVGHTVRVSGRRFRLDAAFVAEKVALEADG